MLIASRTRFLNQSNPEPLVRSAPLLHANPFDLYRRLIIPGRPSFLLESGKGAEGIARYSFLGGDPYLVLSGKADRYELRTSDGTVVGKGDPLTALTTRLRTSCIARPEGVPPFFGGAVGFCSYDAVRQFECLPIIAKDDLGLPDVQFGLFDLIAAIDHVTQTLHLMYCPPLPRFLGESRDKLYREGTDRLAGLEAQLFSRDPPARREEPFARLRATPDQSADAYMTRVRHCQDYIRAGDIYQANLSHRFTIPPDTVPDSGQLNASALYGRLRNVNPSPFSALLSFDEVTLVSSSPERLVRLNAGRVDTRPIAGTRARGRDLVEDRRLAEDLLTNAKERAEHVMLVDLERNDLGRVCRYGTVRADELMLIERYSHVSHIVSNITGELQEGVDTRDVIRAVFPGGTITGVPKIRCMEIIESLEPVRRGAYTGSLGYLSWSGELDLNLIIRTIVLAKGRGYLQVGAGIVADSDPHREYEETLLKAEGVLSALKDV